MSQNDGTKRIFEHSDPALYSRLNEMMADSHNEIEIDGQTYQAAQDMDEDGTPYFILVPAE